MFGRRLDRHVLRSFLPPFVSCAAGLAMLVTIFDLLERADDVFPLIFKGGSRTMAALDAVGTYYAAQTLAFLSGFGGLACLAGGALTVAALARNSELTAARAAGVSLRRAFVPLLLFAAFWGLVQVAICEGPLQTLAPAAEQAQNYIRGRTTETARRVEIKLVARIAVWEKTVAAPGDEPIWKGRQEVAWQGDRLLSDGRTVEPLSITIPRSDRETAYRVAASRARWRGGWWELTDGKFFDYEKGRDESICRPCARLACDIAPVNLNASTNGLAGLSARDLHDLRNDPGARTELWRRATLPLMNVVLLLMGLPLAAAGGARGGRLLPLGTALVLGALYILAAQLGKEVAGGAGLLRLLETFEGGDWLTAMGGPLRMAVDLAMGLPHAAFLAVGGWIYWKMDR